MSTKQVFQETVSRGQRALRLFDELLFESPEICSQCYARIRDREEHEETADRLGTGNRPTETLIRSGDGVVGYDADVIDEYGAVQHHRARTYCNQCGSPGGTASGARICSLQQARRCGDNIIRRLHEMGYYPDVGALYRAVERLKTDPENQGKDREIFAIAMYLALERGSSAPDGAGRPRVGPWQPAGRNRPWL